MLPYEFKQRIDHEVVKLENIEKIMGVMTSVLKSKDIPHFNIMNKKSIIEDFCEHLFEIYVDNESFNKISFDLSVNIESYCTYIRKDDQGMYMISEQPVGTFTITIFNPAQELWTICKQFNYTIGEFK